MKENPFTNILATCSFGLEGVLADELRTLGMEDVSASDARVTFSGGWNEAAKANMHLRTADRVYLVLGQFPATTFDELFEGVRALPWETILRKDSAFPVRGKAVHSKLFSVSDVQSISKKAVVERLKKAYHVDWLQETGASYTIDIALLKDIATVSIDTSGQGLNRRGYRTQGVEAPLRENLAAGLILLSRWKHDRPLLDPFCGSGTIAIEAAIMATNTASGLLRSFAMESFTQSDPVYWKQLRAEAKSLVLPDKPIIHASDSDPDAISIARQNAKRAGVTDKIQFSVAPVLTVKPVGEGGTIVTNPPYGERMGDLKEVHKACKGLGELYREASGWQCCAISAFPEFERWFGKRADKKRKLYNGNMKCDYYMYFK